MSDEQTSGDAPTLDRSNPTNARLAALMVEQTGKVLQGLTRIEKLLSPKGEVAFALAEMFAAMIPDGEPIAAIPEDWVPVVMAINPMTGEFLTIAGPRSEPDGRVEAVETMLARQMQGAVAGAVSAVREAGRPQPMPGEPDYADYVVAGPLDAGTCESCRNVIGDRVSPNAAGDYLEDLQRDCECENGCRLTVEHGANRWTSALGSRNLEEGSEGE